ncbi:MAG: radical SAM family heme chaperone HemW [Chlorobiaceae bacterium]|nr:radical SAM family heme chaperone HemW [Chlorobiaceae bacterium]
MLTLYVHIPFCKTRCSYCDFYLVTRRDHISEFFKALSIETASRLSEWKGQTISAIHFGGGTPSMVPERYLAEWLDEIASMCTFAPDIEIALEANPEDLGGNAMDELRAAGITRLSLGVQSFTPEKLRALGRDHSALESQQVTASALQKFKSVSVDLICGVPDEQLPLWKADLQAAVELQPQHLSVYMLSVEPKTRLHRNVVCGAVTVPDDALQASLYEHALGELTIQGYTHYEVSNFCLPGHHSRYNLASWKREHYLGFGPSAHSFVVAEGQEIRSANVSSLTRYIANPGSAVAFREELSAEERFTEEVFLSLRINSGLDVEFLRKENKLGLRLSQTIARFEERGWIEEHEGTLYLTQKGFLFADLIAGDLIFG